ncbi:lipoprotein, partial [Lactococcus lactis]|uniref:lipoprotein n=1 Tax=Lactococcus lactis TaxID=1358 RepID=UPI003D0CAF5C
PRSYRLAVAVLIGLTLVLAACGRKSALDIPVSADEAVPWTPAGQAAMVIQRDANGKVIQPPTQPRVTPASRTFILDPLLD